MKTNIYTALLAVLPIVAGFTGCKSDDETEAKPAKEILIVEGGNIVIKASEEEKTVTVTADCAWTVSLSDGDESGENGFGSKLAVQPLKGNGNGTLVITTDQNTSLSDRIANITLTSDGGLMQKIEIKQTSSDPGMTVTKKQYEFDAKPTDPQLLTINSNSTWRIIKNSTWMHLSDSVGSAGSKTIEISCDESLSDAERSTIFTIQYGSSSTEIEVLQTGITNVSLNVPSEDVRWSYTQNESTISVRSNSEWRAYIPSAATWLRFADSRSTDNGHNLTGVGDGEIRIVCDENNTSRDRMSAVVIVAGTKNPQQATVVVEQVGNTSQQPYETSVSITNLSLFRESATFLVNIVSEVEVGEFGMVYSTSNEDPTIDDSEVVNLGKGGLSQGALGELTGLSQGTTYYVRAFLKKVNIADTLYSEVLPITTPVSETSVGELTSLYVANNSADFRYSFVADEAVTEYGLVYSASNNEPTASDSVLKINTGGTSRSVLGTIKDLNETTTYYVRAYVISAAGQYVYGPNVVTITTSASATEPGESDNPDPQLSRRK